MRGAADFKFAKDAADRQGEGVSFDYTIDEADKGSPIYIKFDYNCDDSDYADGDVIIYIYDKDATSLKEPVGIEVQAGKGNHFATYQPDNNTSDDFRFVIHQSSTNAAAYDLFFENFKIGPVSEISQPSVAAISDWKDYNPNLLNFALDTGDGNYRSQYRRVGDSVDIRIYGSIETNPTGIIGFTLPDGLSMVDRISSRDVYGVAKGFDGGSNTHLGMVSSGGATTFNVTGDDGTAHWNATTPFTWSAGFDYFSVNVYGIPIQGWSSGSQDVAVVDDNRIVAMSADSYAGAAISNTAEGDLTFTTSSETHSNFATGTGIYTIGTSGWYQVSANTGLQVSSPAAGNKGQLLLYKNGSTLLCECQQEAESASTNTFFSHHVSISAVYLLKGETLKTSYVNNWGESVSLQGNARTNFSVSKISGQNQIIAAETIVARASGNAASAASGAPVIFPTSDFDSHGGYNVSTGFYTTQVSGTYRVSGYVTSANAAITLNIAKDGATDIAGGITDASGEGTFTGLIKCNANQTISLEPSGTLDISGGHMSIERVGN